MNIPYYHTESNVITVDELLSSKNLFDVEIDQQSFLQIKQNEITNHRRLYDNLSKDQRRKYNSGSSTYSTVAQYPVTKGVLLYIPTYSVELKYTNESNIVVRNTIANEYFPPILKVLTTDPGYVPAELDRGNESQVIFPRVTIWLWSRARYLENSGDKGFIDISGDVMSCTIDSSMSEGAIFSIDLAPIQCEWKVDDAQKTSGWRAIKINDSVSNPFINRRQVSFDKNTSFASESKRNFFLYDKIVQENDMIFISFEKLKIDGSLTVDDVHDKWYDLVGLVDSVTTSINASIDLSISIKGRDLTKALLNDNSYFNPYSIYHKNSLYGGEIGERLFDGSFISDASFRVKSLREVVEFIVGRIVSVGYVPNEIINQFTTKSQVVSSFELTKEVKGIWQLCKVFIDPSIADLKVMDANVSNPDGSIYSLFKKVAQEPFVELLVDTYGDKYYMIFRQPPFTQKAITEVLYDFRNQIVDDFKQYEPTTSELPSGSASEDQINKYKQRQIEFVKKQQGSSLSEEERVSLVKERFANQVKKQPIFDDEETATSYSTKYPTIINVNDKDVLSENLRNTVEAYSWYKIVDRGNFAGTTVSLGHIPALYFDIFAQVYGNKQLEVTSNYSDYRFFEEKRSTEQLDIYADQAANHLAFLVETNVYLPFTRQGTLTLNGDRRIKKGHWIYYRPTNEIYYVTSVSNSISVLGSIDRTTTVTVERGMVLDYIKPQIEEVIDINGNKKQIEVSYFNLVDIARVRESVYRTVSIGRPDEKFDYKKDVIVNEDVFNFFLQKRQFKEF